MNEDLELLDKLLSQTTQQSSEILKSSFQTKKSKSHQSDSNSDLSDEIKKSRFRRKRKRYSSSSSSSSSSDDSRSRERKYTDSNRRKKKGLKRSKNKNKRGNNGKDSPNEMSKSDSSDYSRSRSRSRGRSRYKKRERKRDYSSSDSSDSSRGRSKSRYSRKYKKKEYKRNYSSSTSSDSSRSRSRSRDRNRYKKREKKRDYSSSDSSDSSRSRSRSKRYKYKYEERGSRNSKKSHDRHQRSSYEDKKNSRYDNNFHISKAEQEKYDKIYNVNKAERDLRTVFISELSSTTTEKDIFEFFSMVEAKVREIELIVGKKSRKSKGFGYVEFYRKEDVQKALTLSQHQLNGKTVIVQVSEAEKNIKKTPHFLQRNESRKIYVGNLHPKVNEEMIKNIFKNFGEIEHMTFYGNSTNPQYKGYAYISFKRPDSALKSISLNETMIEGYSMKVFLVAQSRKEAENESNEKFITSNQKRLEMMNILSNKTDMIGPQQNYASPEKYILVKNIFDTSQEGANSELEICNEVKSECEAKYGKVVEIFADKESKGIYIHFETLEYSKNAFLGLNGRWFDFRLLSVEYISQVIFQKMSSKAK